MNDFTQKVLSDYLHKYSTGINNNVFDHLYEDLRDFIYEQSRFEPKIISDLTEIFWQAGIHPELHTDTLPSFFMYHLPVKNFKISEDIKYIGSSAFEGTQIQSIYLPDNTKAIYSHAFRDCEQLVEVSFPEFVNIIGDGWASGCRNLLKVNYRGSFEDFKKYMIGHFISIGFIRHNNIRLVYCEKDGVTYNIREQRVIS